MSSRWRRDIGDDGEMFVIELRKEVIRLMRRNVSKRLRKEALRTDKEKCVKEIQKDIEGGGKKCVKAIEKR